MKELMFFKIQLMKRIKEYLNLKIKLMKRMKQLPSFRLQLLKEILHWKNMNRVMIISLQTANIKLIAEMKCF